MGVGIWRAGVSGCGHVEGRCEGVWACRRCGHVDGVGVLGVDGCGCVLDGNNEMQGFGGVSVGGCAYTDSTLNG